MIDKATAKRQVMRLGGLRDFPKDNAEVLRDLISAVEGADSAKQAEDCISSFVDFADDQTRCPLATILRRWLYDRQTQRDARTNGCPYCKGLGFIIVERGGLTGARDCACRSAA